MKNRDLHRCAARAEQEFANFRIRLSLHRLPINGNYSIAETQTGSISRRLIERGTDESVYIFVFTKVFDRRADAKILRALLSSERRIFNWIEVGRVGIEHAEHAADR